VSARPPYQPIRKPLGLRVQELIDSLQVMRDSLDAIRQGKGYQLLPLSGQLRALLYAKRKTNKPLLLDLADQLGRELQVYHMPGVEQPLPPELPTPVHRLAGFPFTLQQELPKQTACSLVELLDLKIVEHNGKSYTALDLIKFYANKAGGAHFAPAIESEYAELLSVNFGQLQNALMQIGEVTLKQGARLLKELSDIEVHYILIIPNQELQQPAVIWDSRYLGTNMRFYCRVTPFRQLVFGMVSIDGVGVEVGAKKLVDLAQPTHFRFSVSLNEDLSTDLLLEANGERLNSIRVPRPLFVASDPVDYDTFVNRSHEDPNAGLKLGFVQIAMFAAGASTYGRARALLYFEEQTQNPEQKVIGFERGGYGSIPRGERDIQMTGPVHFCSVKSYPPPPPPPASPAPPS
jgi:hypothetical protein